MRFVDEAKIKLKAGDGGDGIVAWRREKFVPLGGPAGGNGGRGGDIIIEAKNGMNSLLDLKQTSLITAPSGGKGQSKNKTGRNASDTIVFVPIGTIVKEEEPGFLKAEMLKDGQRITICKGGDGGFGNSHFKNPLCNAPNKSTEGIKGEEKTISLTLKLMADVGLLGFPNAGKSTLLSRLSNAQPKIADYPFTTIKPMVGVCQLDIDKDMVIADIPGLIEGASMGAGLGIRFLKHLERVSILCHLIDITDEKILAKRYKIINQELKNYSPLLSELPQIIVINKIDSLDEDKKEQMNEFLSYLDNINVLHCSISAVSGEGLQKLKEMLYEKVSQHKINNKLIVKKVFDPAKNIY